MASHFILAVPNNKMTILYFSIRFLDLGPSLMDEMNSMFRAMTTSNKSGLLNQDFEKTNKNNENTENIFKCHRKNNSNQSTTNGNYQLKLFIRNNHSLSRNS
jgi:hypothetical protein